MLAKVSVAICLAAATATLLLIIPGGYCRFTTVAEASHVFAIVGPYALLALLAWRHRDNPRTSRTLLLLNVLVALVALCVFAAETSSYHSEVAAFVTRDPERGAEYIEATIQRIALFVVPAIQWFVSLAAAGSLLVRAGVHR